MVNKTYILSGLALLALLNNNKNKANVSRSEKKDIDINTNDDQNELEIRLNILENEISDLKNYTERNFNLIKQVSNILSSFSPNQISINQSKISEINQVIINLLKFYREDKDRIDTNVFKIAVLRDDFNNLRDDVNKLKDRIKKLEEDAIEVFYYYPYTNINDFMEWYNDTERMKRGNPFTIKKMSFNPQITALCYRNGSGIIAMKKTRDIKYFFKFLDKDDKPILTMEQLFKECL